MLTLLRNARVYAPEPLEMQNLLLGGGRILAMGADLDPSGLNLQCFDLEGAIVAPGLVDSLVHISGGGGEGGFESRTRPLEAQIALQAGVTTVIGALGTDDVTRSHADLIACARALSAEGVNACALSGSYHVPLRTLTGSLRDDLVLIPDIIGVGEIAIADHRGGQPSVHELARIAAQAGVGGMLAGKRGTVLVHLGDDDDGLDLLFRCHEEHRVQPGRWLPTHVNRKPQLLDQTRRWLGLGGNADITTSTTENLLAAGEIAAASALVRLLEVPLAAGRVTLSSDAQASLPQFDDSGRLLAMGSADIGSLLQCIRCAVHDHKLALHRALACATINPARIWGLARKGWIGIGADADLMVLDSGNLSLLQVFSGGVARLEPTSIACSGAACLAD